LVRKRGRPLHREPTDEVLVLLFREAEIDEALDDLFDGLNE